MSTALRLSISEYDRMIAAGIFDGPHRRRVELIHGELRSMSPIGPEHDQMVEELTRWSYQVADSKSTRIRGQCSLGLPSTDSVPEPDLVWVARRDYWDSRPTAKDVLLLIEVAASGLRYDLGEKAGIYATAGIRDYWVIDIEQRRVVVHRDPGPAGFGSVEVYAHNEVVHPLCSPSASLRLGELYPRVDEGTHGGVKSTE